MGNRRRGLVGRVPDRGCRNERWQDSLDDLITLCAHEVIKIRLEVNKHLHLLLIIIKLNVLQHSGSPFAMIAVRLRRCPRRHKMIFKKDSE